MLLKPLLLNGKSAVDESSWIATLSSSSYDSYGRSIVVSPDGKYIYICGQSIGYFSETNQYRMSGLIAKYDSSGNLQWQRTLAFIEPIIFNSIVISPDGNSIYVCGTNTNGVIGLDDIIIAKYSSSGDLLWKNLYGDMDNDSGYSITISPDGNSIYVCGSTYSVDSHSNERNCIIAKYDSSGNLQWQRTLGESITDDEYGITISPDGNSIYVCGSTNSVGTMLVSAKFLIAKYDSSGNIQWQRTLGGRHSDGGYGITISPDGNYIYVCGCTSSTGAGSYDCLIAKYDSSGNIQWQRTLGGSSNDYGYGITISPDENSIYICGYINSSYDCLIAKYDSSGNLQWQRTLSGTSKDYGYGITISPDENSIYICGYTNSTGADNNVCLIAKITEKTINQETVEIGPFTIAPSTLTSSESTLTSSESTLTSSESTLTSSESTLTSSSESTLTSTLYTE